MDLINPITEKFVNSYISNPTGAVIITSSQYSGADEIVNHIAQKLLGEHSKNNLLLVQQSNGKKIGIDQVRELKKSITTITNSSSKIGRVVVIRNVGSMTTEAQNAVLKMIEEPNNRTAFLLQTNTTKDVLGTIKSRCLTIDVLPINKEQAQKYAKSKEYNNDDLKKALLLSGGDSVLFKSILANDNLEIFEGINKAKNFLSSPVFSRLSKQKEYSKEDKLNDLLNSVERVSEAAMHASDTKGLMRWKHCLETVEKSRELLSKNVNTKLVFLNLCTHL